MSLTHSPFNFVKTSSGQQDQGQNQNQNQNQMNNQMNNQSHPNGVAYHHGVDGSHTGAGSVDLGFSSSNFTYQHEQEVEIPNVNNDSSSTSTTTTTINTAGQPITTTNNNMNSKINKRLDSIPENLGRNGKTPSGKPRLFVCNVCTRAFARHEHLKRHERSHTKEKPFSCGVCQRKFSRRDLLLRHAQKLHAGCDDAIKRLRRKSARSKSVSSPTPQYQIDEKSESNSLESQSVQPPIRQLKRQKTNESFNSNNSSSSTNQHHHQQQQNPTNNSNLLFGNSHSAQYNQLHNQHRFVNEGRRSSFSAASAANYASVPQTQNYQDSVEFSTPQLLPVDNILGTNSQDHNSINNWLSDINTLPGLDFLNNFSLTDAQNHTGGGNITNSGNQNQGSVSIGPTTLARHNTTLGFQQDSNTPSSLLSESRVSPSSSNSRPRRHSRKQSRKSSTVNVKRENDIFGYSFYDDDYTFANQHEDYNDIKFSYPKLPSSYLKDSNSNSSPDDTANNSSTNFNDYDLLSELEVPNHEEKILAAGYSFYGSNDFAPSTISPSNMFFNENNNNHINNHNTNNFTVSNMDVDQLLNSNNNYSVNNSNAFSNQNQLNNGNLSNHLLFTENMKSTIEKVLAKYPFVNIPPPDLPSLDVLNSFAENFKTKFLSHYPFIHISTLNELNMHEYTKNKELPNDLTSHVCLPLLIATTGSLYTNNKKISADLYEISRRCIHVYLDLRKKTDDIEKATTHNSPLWLVQSLILSVLYGLFAEYDESDLSVILRQVNALCTLIKVSKFTSLKFEHENIEINDGYFKEYIMYQSKIRTVFMIFNISSMLTCFYEISPFIKYREIKCDLPDLESFWDCLNLDEFKQVCVKNSSLNYSLNLEKIINDMLMNNQISYKLSEFGANIVMFSLLQYFYFNKKQSLTNNFAGISPFHSNSSNLVKNYKWENMLINESLNINLESILLKNILVIRSLKIDLSKMKDSMWNRRWNDLTEEFSKINAKNDDLIDACDYSIRTISLIFINDVNSSNFRKCLSLTLQCLMFNFVYIARFLHSFEKRILNKPTTSITPSNLKPSELKLISKNFSIYIKIAKFLADLEQIMVKNFGYNDPESKLATKEFDESRFNFGIAPRLLNEAEYSTNINPIQVYQVAKLRLSSNILKIGQFVYSHVFEEEMNFNIFKSLSGGLYHLRINLDNEHQQDQHQFQQQQQKYQQQQQQQQQQQHV
ncbi:hypothetical protein BN7_2345 [Wickerhamomyces ciferrii]|uniref:C2H2-type domain-containing protein n=1 Tax=Wickerhamomyces ciferrii (strain ATCC 14091 / BCRC 22168 / CBS 111 / JCM 3599 / NBRC 0793 / NRRL Y-1031 F-60-10) TaxID=1206466 RepID=K0KIJ9_WICCF|nr:uncharacterized protein BN7_2345 [Wickerhamomyces ciferrii]CCH42801.1 hypothetical protein BN7_2345 [Wickerhamomyces ciferrii]